MDLSFPISSVIPTVDGPVLAVLAGTTTPLSGRQVARLTAGRASQRGVADTLARLTAAGIVLREDRPPSALYRLNREHLAAPAIVELANLRRTMIDLLSQMAASWRKRAASVVLFGSAARGDATATSDLDVLVVRPPRVAADDEAWREQLADFVAQAEAMTGNATNVVEYGAEELRKIARRHEPVLLDAERDGIVLAGSDLAALRREAPRSRRARP